VTIAIALVGAALAVSAIVVAQRNASNEPIWFAVSGFARFSIAFGLLALALFASDHVSSFLLAIFGLIILCVIAGGVAQLLHTAAETRRLRLFTGYRTTPSRLVLSVAGGVLLLLVPGGILFVAWDSFWLSTHGGGTAIALTGSVLVVAALLVSALVRLLVAAILAIVDVLKPRAGESVIGSTFASFWDSAEAVGVVATTILALSSIGFGAWSHQGGERIVHAVSPRDPVRPLATVKPQKLLTGLAPVLMLTGHDSWPPQRVDSFLSKSTVLDLRGRAQLSRPTVKDLTDGCPGAARPCLLVEADCARPGCVAGTMHPARPVAYGRVVLKGHDPRVSWRISPFRGELTGVAQWWIFAPYDRWTAPLFLGLGSAVQEHAADWEAVTIGFSRVRPLFVALTSHCGGTWRQYRDVEVAEQAYGSKDTLGRRLHTLVAYADGSHALYFEPEWARTPDALGCALERASGWFRAVTYAANALDTTRDNVRRLLMPVVGSQAARVLSFPAYWSYSSTYTFETPLHTFTTTAGTTGKPAGPGSPAKKELFIDPVRTIFCRPTWNYDAPPDGTSDVNLPSAVC
jgi:hypothetical protein